MTSSDKCPNMASEPTPNLKQSGGQNAAVPSRISETTTITRRKHTTTITIYEVKPWWKLW